MKKTVKGKWKVTYNPFSENPYTVYRKRNAAEPISDSNIIYHYNDYGIISNYASRDYAYELADRLNSLERLKRCFEIGKYILAGCIISAAGVGFGVLAVWLTALWDSKCENVDVVAKLLIVSTPFAFIYGDIILKIIEKVKESCAD